MGSCRYCGKWFDVRWDDSELRDHEAECPRRTDRHQVDMEGA